MIGQRVVAWRGDRAGQRGVVVRVDGIYHCFVRWDDGEVTHYESAAVTWQSFCK